jgi:D-alanyl-D-alanine carboxypeptidase/D-alanyl-D-alanine-endopeptidase (penicillin-binding protein 4)
VEAVVQQHLMAVMEAGMAEPTQGVWIQSEDEILADHQGNLPLSAASLTKVATTLAALATWGANHQFETLVSATGPIAAGVLNGDLIIQGTGDPFFVWEEAIALGNALENVGVKRVTGNLVITNNFVMNFQTEPNLAGNLLQQGMNTDLWNAEVIAQYRALPPGTLEPQLLIDGTVQVISTAEVIPSNAKLLIRHKSMPLVDILKAMNTFSNNVMAEILANGVGGPQIVANKAAELTGIPVEEIQLINGSGLGSENRISPKAVSAMLIAIQYYLQSQQLNLNIADLFPVSGRDQGTLQNRNLPWGATVKTGTLHDVSSLAGVIPTRDRGLIWFTIINVGTADLDVLHNEQDLLLQKLLEKWGTTSTLPMEITPSDRANNEANQLGSISRNEIL